VSLTPGLPPLNNPTFGDPTPLLCLLSNPPPIRSGLGDIAGGVCGADFLCRVGDPDVDAPNEGEPVREEGVDLVYLGGVTMFPINADADKGVLGLSPSSLRCCGVSERSVNSSAGERS